MPQVPSAPSSKHANSVVSPDGSSNVTTVLLIAPPLTQTRLVTPLDIGGGHGIYRWDRATRTQLPYTRGARASQARRETRRNAAIFIAYARRCAGRRRSPSASRLRRERVQAQGFHEAGAAGAGAERGHGGERVAHDDAQAELAPIACGDDAGDPRRERAQPPAVGEAEQGVGEGEAWDVRGDLGAGGLVLERGRRVGRDAESLPT